MEFNIQSLIKYISKEKVFTIPKIQMKFGVGYKAVYDLIKKLESEGKIEYVKGLDYKITEHIGDKQRVSLFDED